MAYRRGYRKRFNGVWFPTVGTSTLNDPMVITGVGPGTIVRRYEPFTFDAPGGTEVAYSAPSNLATGGQLAGALGPAYLVKRIVGQIFVWIPTQGNGIIDIQVAAGIFVDDVGDTGTWPVGNTVSANISQWKTSNHQRRWVWRRHWLLTDPYYSNPQSPELGTPLFPSSNCEYGDIRSGTQVDVKTRTLVKPGQRIGLVVETSAFIVTGEPEDTEVNFYQELRMFGKPMMRSGGP